MSASISSYGSAVSQLQAASRGTYGGPSIPERVLKKAYETITGLDTGQLRSGGRSAAGDSEIGGLLGLLKPLGRMFGGVAGGMIISELVDRVSGWADNRNEAEEVAEAADRAADAIDTTVRESDDGVDAILGQLAGIIAQITNHLSTLDPTEHPEAFIATVQAGAEIINDAAAMVLGLCEDRDRAIENCYGALIEHGRRVCEAPAPGVAPAVGGAGAGGGGVGGGAGTVPESPVTTPGITPGATPGTAPASVDPPTADSPEAGKPTVKTEPEACDPEPRSQPCDPEPVQDEKPEEKPDGEQDEDEAGVETPPAEDGNREHTINSAISGIGIGLLVVGVGVLVDFLGEVAQTMGMDAAQMPPAPSPDATPLAATPTVEPVPAPEPVAEPTPEPTPKPTPASELHLVAEPPPKPQPGMVQAAATAAVHDPTVGEPVQVDYQQAATPVAPVTPPPAAPAPGGTPGDAPDDAPGRVRRVGGW